MPLVKIPDGGGSFLSLMEYGPDKFRGPPELPEQQLCDVKNVDIRDDDVILLSYPKSGCHWLWEMTSMFLAGSSEAETVEKENYMMEYVSHEKLQKLPSPRVLNTHLRFEELPEKIRNGKVSSLCHHIIWLYT